MPDVLVVGSANVDLVVPVPLRPAAGQTVLGGDLGVHPGGKGANQAVAAARLGARVAFVGRVGDDAHGRLIRESLAVAGVDHAHLRIAAAPTGVALILLTPDGENSIVVSPGANALVGTEDVDVASDALGRPSVLLLQREIDPRVSAHAARRAAEAGARVLLSLAPAGEVPGDLLRLADPLVVNEHEAADLLAASGDPEDHARGLLRLGARSAVITLGPRGAAVAAANGVASVPAPPVRPVDTTGAGDAFTGALAWRLSAGDDLVGAAAVAARAAALSVTRSGAQPSFPTAAELDAVG